MNANSSSVNKSSYCILACPFPCEQISFIKVIGGYYILDKTKSLLLDHREREIPVEEKLQAGDQLSIYPSRSDYQVRLGLVLFPVSVTSIKPHLDRPMDFHTPLNLLWNKPALTQIPR